MRTDAEFVVSVLDLFKGQLSLSDVINTDIATINFLCEARQKYLEAVEKAKAEALKKVSEQTNNSKIFNPMTESRF